MAFAHGGGHGEDRWTVKTPGDLKDGQRPSPAVADPAKARPKPEAASRAEQGEASEGSLGR